MLQKYPFLPSSVGFLRISKEEENQAILNVKNNSKAFFSFSRARQKIKSQLGPFLDPSAVLPNSDSDFAAGVLSDHQ